MESTRYSMSMRLVGVASFSIASAIMRMTLGAALKLAVPRAEAVALPMLSLVLVKPATMHGSS